MKFEDFAVYSGSGYGQIADLCKWVENLIQKEHEYIENMCKISGKCLLQTEEITEFLLK
jgi:hypothetical protein